MSQPAKAQEPSMEEILASIRRIIADDDASKPAAKPPPSQAGAAPGPAAAAPRPSAPAPAPPPQPPSAPALNQKDVDALLDGGLSPAEDRPQREESEDILDLTEPMAGPAASPFQTIDGQPDIIFSDPVVHPEPAPRLIEEARRPPAPSNSSERPLLSGATAAAVDSAFNTLAQTVLVHNARTLEDLVREMLRPMLKAWLDDNLPAMVERIVRAEIERVSRGRG
jgi:cell pole-organizing protein PopZ